MDIMKMVEVLSNMGPMELLKLESHLKQIIDDNSEVEDKVDWFQITEFTDLTSNDLLKHYNEIMTNYTSLSIYCVTIEKYEICGLLKEVMIIETNSMIDIIENIPVNTIADIEERDELIEEIVYIETLCSGMIKDYVNTIMR